MDYLKLTKKYFICLPGLVHFGIEHSLFLLQVVHDDGAVSYLKIQFQDDLYSNCFF